MNKLINNLEILFSRIIAPLEWVMLFVVIGGGVFLLFYSKFYPLTQIKRAFILLLKNEKKKGISRFQALSAVLAATVGIFLELQLQFIWADQGF
jgi:AGCS family alanine or glycine:cation symporter